MKKFALIWMLLLAFAVVTNAQEAKARTEKIHVLVGDPKVHEASTFAEWGVTKLPKYRALIIGVSEYQHPSAALVNLAEPVNDAQRLYDVLTTHYTFNSDDIIFLKNPRGRQIVDTLEYLAHNVKADENLLVFYAGHGIFDKKLNTGYWIPADGEAGRPSTYLSNTVLRDYLKGITSRHTFLISDACFSGSIFAAGRSMNMEDEIGKFGDLNRIKSRKALTSGNFQTVPDKSIFMEYLIRTLTENVKPYISATSLYTKTYNLVENNSRILPQYGAIQDAGDEGTGGSFCFIRKSN